MKINSQLKKRLKDQLIKSIKTEREETVIVKSAYALSESEIATLRQKCNIPSSFVVENIVDESIIGGLVIHHASTVYDISIKSSITNLVARLQAAL